MRKVSISASIAMDVAARLADEAKQRGESLSEVINRALQDYVERHPMPKSGKQITVRAGDQSQN